MEKLTSKEFLDQLKSNTLKSPFILKGIVKKSDKDSEVLFARKGNFGNWTAIPASMIESVVVIKTFVKNNETFAVVKLHMKMPTTPEGTIFYDLLSSMGKEDMEDEKCGHHSMSMCKTGFSRMKDRLLGEWKGHFCPHCGSKCHHEHCEKHEEYSDEK